MDISKMLFKMYVISENYLTKKKNRLETVYSLLSVIDIKDICDSSDKLLFNWYYAIKYLTDEYSTLDREIKYYVDCYNNLENFSEEKRDKIIKNSN